MLWIGALALAVLAFANGANDNAKPVATLVGAGLVSPRKALAAGTIAAFVGSVSAVVIGKALFVGFSAKGLVGAQFVTPPFVLAVALGAGATVLTATRLGLPVSTTHSLVGAIVGAGFVAAEVNFARLSGLFLLPLLGSPVVAFAATSTAYPVVHRLRKALGISRAACICVGDKWVKQGAHAESAAIPFGSTALTIEVGNSAACRERYHGAVIGVEAQSFAAALHWVSALTVSFARGLQDGAKIAGVGLVLLGEKFGVLVVIGTALAMGAGGWFAASRVEKTMAERITSMRDGPALLANLLSAGLILGATSLGAPVSATHVTAGALIGLRAHLDAPKEDWWGRILFSWAATLPVAALLAAACAYQLY